MRDVRILGLILSALMAPLSAGATAILWTGAGSSANWNDAANWNPRRAPMAGDTVTFGTGTKSCSINVAANIDTLNLQGTYSGTLTLAAPSLTVAHLINVTKGKLQANAGTTVNVGGNVF